MEVTGRANLLVSVYYKSVVKMDETFFPMMPALFCRICPTHPHVIPPHTLPCLPYRPQHWRLVRFTLGTPWPDCSKHCFTISCFTNSCGYQLKVDELTRDKVKLTDLKNASTRGTPSGALRLSKVPRASPRQSTCDEGQKLFTIAHIPACTEAGSAYCNAAALPPHLSGLPNFRYAI